MSTATSDQIKPEQIAEPGYVRDHALKELQELGAYIPVVEAAIVKAAKALSESFKGFKINNLDDVKKLNELTKQSSELTVVHSKIQQAKIKLTEQEIAQNQVDSQKKRDRIALLKSEIVEMDKSVGTLRKLEAANKSLEAQRGALNKEDKDYAVNLKRINDALDKNNQYIKENSDQLKKQRLNVGNYAASIKEAFEGTGVIGDSINKYLGIITLLSSKIEGVVSSLAKKKVAEEAATTVTNANTTAEQANSAAVEESAVANATAATSKEAATIAEETSTAATEVNTGATEANVVITEAAAAKALALSDAEKAVAAITAEATVAEKINTTSLETQTVATEAATVASEGLGKSLLALAKNPYVIAAVAIAALAKVVYDNVTATQAQKDSWDAGEEALKAYAKAALVAGVDAKQLAKDIRALTLEEFKRQDLAIGALTEKAKLRAEAAKARAEANEEGKTTKQRIELQQKFIDFTRQANEKERQELELDVKIKSDFVKKSGIMASREQRKAEQEAIAALSANLKQTEDETRKAQKQVTTLTDKYNDDTRKMLQDAQREELEQIDTFSKSKADHLRKQLDKDLQLNRLDTEQKIANLKDQQKKLGEISPAFTDEQGIYHAEVDNRANFQREIAALQNEGTGKSKQLTEKTNEEIAQLNISFQEKQIELETKYRADLAKLDEDYLKQVSANNKQEHENDLKDVQFKIDSDKGVISKLEEQRALDIASGRKKNKLSLSDVKKYFDDIEKLQAEYNVKKKEGLTTDAENEKSENEKKLVDDIQAIRDKYAKRKIEEEKAIRDNEVRLPSEITDKNATPEQVAEADRQYNIRITTKVTDHNIDLDQDAEAEIIRRKAINAEKIKGIEEKLKGDLNDIDRKALNDKLAILKQEETYLNNDIENRKKRAEEIKKIENEITDGIEEGLRKHSEIQQQADQKDIDFHKRTLEVETKLASEGKDNTLAAELAASDKAEEKKLQDAKKAQKQQEYIALEKVFFSALTAALDKGKNGFAAFAEALGEAGAAKAAIAALVGGGFYEGTESLAEGDGTPFKNGKDDILISAKKGERIVGYEDSQKIKGMTNKEVVDASLMYMNDDFKNLYIPQFNSTNATTTIIPQQSHDYKLAEIVDKRFNELQRTIADKPVSSIDEIGLMGLIKTVHEGQRITRIHYKTRPSLRARP